MKARNQRLVSQAACAGFALALLCPGGTATAAPGESGKPAGKDLLPSKTVTQPELDLAQQPFVFAGVPRGSMAQYFNGRTAGTRSFVVGQFQLAPGSEPHPIHAHADDEVLIVASGEGEITCAGRTTPVAAGSVMYAAPQVDHGIRNTGRTTLVFYFIKWIEIQPAAPASPP